MTNEDWGSSEEDCNVELGCQLSAVGFQLRGTGASRVFETVAGFGVFHELLPRPGEHEWLFSPVTRYCQAREPFS